MPKNHSDSSAYWLSAVPRISKPMPWSLNVGPWTLNLGPPHLDTDPSARSSRTGGSRSVLQCGASTALDLRAGKVRNGCDWKWRSTGRKHAFGLRRQDAAFPARHHRPSWPNKRVPLTLPPCSQSGDMSPQSKKVSPSELATLPRAGITESPEARSAGRTSHRWEQALRFDNGPPSPAAGPCYASMIAIRWRWFPPARNRRRPAAIQ